MTFRRSADGSMLSTRQASVEGLAHRFRTRLRFGCRAHASMSTPRFGGYSPSLTSPTLVADRRERHRGGGISDSRNKRSPDTNVWIRNALRGKEHGKYGGVRVADRVDADAADHRRHGAVRLGFDPCGTVFQAEMGQAGQQHAP